MSAIIQNIKVPKVLGHASTTMADSTTYCYGATQGNTAQTVPNGSGANFKFVNAKPITKIQLDLRMGTIGSNEVSSLYLRNCTDSTEVLIGTIDYSQANYVGASGLTLDFDVNLAVDTTKAYTIKEVTQAMITNPTNVAKTLHVYQ